MAWCARADLFSVRMNRPLFMPMPALRFYLSPAAMVKRRIRHLGVIWRSFSEEKGEGFHHSLWERIRAECSLLRIQCRVC